MLLERIEEMLSIEMQCINRDCDKNCEKCELAQNKDELLEAFDHALAFIEIMKNPDVLKLTDKSKYEYHYDHTDCIWYKDGTSKCPVTCSQYRDGWNDAMQYIFQNGIGYHPYVRSRGMGEDMKMDRICYHGARECAKTLGISRDTLRKIIRNDPTFPVIKTSNNGQYLFPVEQIKEWAAAQASKRSIPEKESVKHK